jgi:hypothetical protein
MPVVPASTHSFGATRTTAALHHDLLWLAGAAR